MKRTDSKERIELTGEEVYSLVKNGRAEDESTIMVVPRQEQMQLYSMLSDRADDIDVDQKV